MVVPVPIWATAPLPEITTGTVATSLRSKASVALSTISLVTLPDVPPSPSCSVPAAIVVPLV